MHSMQELNGYSDLPVEFNDDRPYEIISLTTTGDKTVAVDQRGSVELPVGIPVPNITSAPDGVLYTIDLTGFNTAGFSPEPTIVWDAPAPHVVLTTNPGDHTWTAGNIGSSVRYSSISSPALVLQSSHTGNVNIQTTWSDELGNTASYTTTVQVIPLLTVPNNIDYSEDTRFDIDWNIVDSKTDSSSALYSLDFVQIFPTPTTENTTCRFLINGTGTARTGNLSMPYAPKSEMNGYTVSVDPPVDYTGPILINMTFKKDVGGQVLNQWIEPINCGCVLNTAEYTRPSSLGVTIKDSVNLGGFQVLDGDDPTRQYLMTLTIPSNSLGNLKTISSSGTTITASGSRAQVNAVLGSVNTAFRTAGADIAGGGSTGSVNITMNLWRTSPANVALATNQVTTVTVREPAASELWQGGVYVCKYNSTTGSLSSPNYHLIVRYSQDTPLYDAPVTRFSIGGGERATDSSRTDGYTNTYTFFGVESYQTGTPFYNARYWPGGNWYVPSIQELSYGMFYVPTQFQNGTYYWSSTWDYAMTTPVTGNYVLSLLTAGVSNPASQNTNYTNWTLASATSTFKQVSAAFKRIAI